MERVLSQGTTKPSRNGVTRSLFGERLVIEELRYGRLPLLTTRKMFTKGILGEYAAFLREPTHLDDFEKFGCNYWDNWADEDGKLTLDYGYDWIPQFEHVIAALRAGGTDRRMLVDTWNWSHLNELSLPCCHYAYQFYKRGDEVDVVWSQRSVDVAIGLPSDVVLASVMLISLSREVDLKPGRIIMNFGDTHLYGEHWEDCKELMSRTPFGSPRYNYNHMGFFKFEPQDLHVEPYRHHDPIKFKLKA